ncbi:MAG: hypothetical protein WDW36_003063 [Sanguina aurantia]
MPERGANDPSQSLIRLHGGKGRGIVTTSDVSQGELLLVSLPVGPVLRAPEGYTLLPEHLASALGQRQLSPADRFRMLQLCSSNERSSNPAVTLQDLGEGAALRVKVAESPQIPSKGFGAPAKSAPPPLDLDLSDERLLSVLAFSSHGAARSDQGARMLRGEPQQAFLGESNSDGIALPFSTTGLWPEHSLLNHGCAPNARAIVVGDALLVRAMAAIPKGSEVTTSYLTEGEAQSVGGTRRAALEKRYGFTCSCDRCLSEASLPADIQRSLSGLQGLEPVGPGVEAATGLKGSCLGVQDRIDELEGLLEQSSVQDQLVARAAALTALRQANENGGERSAESRETAESALMATLAYMAPGCGALLDLTTVVLVSKREKYGKQDPRVADLAKAWLRQHLHRYGAVSDAMLSALVEARIAAKAAAQSS